MAEKRTRQKKKRRKVQDVLPVNTKAKDTFFKKVYESEERQRRLVSFLLGIESEKVAVACVPCCSAIKRMISPAYVTDCFMC